MSNSSKLCTYFVLLSLLALKAATDTHTVITGLLEKATDQAEKDALTTCENADHIVMNSFQQAATAFFEKDYNSMLEYEKSEPRG
ncbi:hypothetical protein V6N13_008961 [Hibiscus sabdariffa]|uniref:Uncharacterized protein n=1 Tax=Hibiscus sabdariffa TaxID=183260 RepID=A0ABR2NR93_9ROSI